ncbi:6859_t:CDS:2 [Entrophospora sp. SA101]|nr:6859_t:CDS:2 [Entrophospora sp. SA101]
MSLLCSNNNNSNSIFENSNVNNPISQLSNKLFQDATTSKRSLILAASSTEQEESRKFPSLVNSSFRTTAMNNYEENEFFPSKNKDNININNDLLEEDEEWSEEWSDEKLTELYIKQHGLDQSLDDYDNNDNLSKNNDLMTFHTNHHDLFQAQLYLFDHIFSTILTHQITSSSCRPSPSSEWNWTRLFSNSRWNRKKINNNKYLKNVARERLQLLIGHFIVNAISETIPLNTIIPNHLLLLNFFPQSTTLSKSTVFNCQIECILAPIHDNK